MSILTIFLPGHPALKVLESLRDAQHQSSTMLLILLGTIQDPLILQPMKWQSTISISSSLMENRSTIFIVVASLSCDF